VVRRSQGLWGISGSFIQWLNNRLDVATTFHKGIGPAGREGEQTPERGAPFGMMGIAIAGRFAAQAQEIPFEPVRGCVIRGNRLSYGQRVLMMWGYGGERKKIAFVPIRDVLINDNDIAHTPVGIELDQNVQGDLVSGNRFEDVARPVLDWRE
jgi:hypothetical protein